MADQPDYTTSMDIISQTLTDVNINIDAQDIGISLTAVFAAEEGNDKSFEADLDNAVWNDDAEVTWLVAGVDALYITAFGCSCLPHGFIDEDDTMYFIVDIGDNNAAGEKIHVGGEGGLSMSLNKPLVIPVGRTFFAKITRKGTGTSDIKISAFGYTK